MTAAQRALGGCQMAAAKVTAVDSVSHSSPSLQPANVAVNRGSFFGRALLRKQRHVESMIISGGRRTSWKHARRVGQSETTRCAASGAAAGEPAEEDPYQVLGVNPLRGFDGAMVAHRKKRNEAEKKGDKEALDRYDAAYNKIMMKQLSLRQKGMTMGSLEVSKDIKYADQMPIFPWMPRRIRAAKNDKLINLALSSAFVLWVLIAGYAEWRPLQIMGSVYMVRNFLRLKTLAGSAPPPGEFDEEADTRSSRDTLNRGILLRSMGLVFGCIAAAAVGYTALVKGCVLLGVYPTAVATGQELFTTAVSAVSLFFITTFYK